MWNFDLLSFVLGGWVGSTFLVISILLIGKLFDDDKTKELEKLFDDDETKK